MFIVENKLEDAKVASQINSMGEKRSRERRRVKGRRVNEKGKGN
jgi:hypothetical protein